MISFAPYKILHIELSQGIPTLTPEAKYQGIYAVFWWYGIPLGHQEISTVELPMPARSLYYLIVQTITPAVHNSFIDKGFKARLPISKNPSRDTLVDFYTLMTLLSPLKQLQENFSQPVTTGSVSVIVCTRNRPQQLAKCLYSLSYLSQRPKQILVVDNAPTDDATFKVVAQMPGIEYVLEPRPGLSIARNTGIRHSTGDIIAFTDDDAIVHPDWSIRLQQGFYDPKIMAVTGLMLPAELETEAQLIFQRSSGGPSWGYHSLTFDSQFFEEMKHQGVPVWYIGAGANMAFRRQAFELVGYFDERLGAGASGCSEDSEVWYRILADGWICRYEPTAVIYHYHRSDLDGLKHQAYQYMRGHVAALLIQFFNYKHWGNLRRLFIILPKYYAMRLWREFKTGFEVKRSSIFSEIAGCLAGIKFYINNKKVPTWQSLPSTRNHNTSTEEIELRA